MCGAVDVDIFPLSVGSTEIESVIANRDEFKIRFPCFSWVIIKESLISRSLKNDTAIVGCGICRSNSRGNTNLNILIGYLKNLTLNKGSITINSQITNDCESTTNTNIILEICNLEGYICTYQRCDKSSRNLDIYSVKIINVYRGDGGICADHASNNTSSDLGKVTIKVVSIYSVDCGSSTNNVGNNTSSNLDISKISDLSIKCRDCGISTNITGYDTCCDLRILNICISEVSVRNSRCSTSLICNNTSIDLSVGDSKISC